MKNKGVYLKGEEYPKGYYHVGHVVFRRRGAHIHVSAKGSTLGDIGEREEPVERYGCTVNGDFFEEMASQFIKKSFFLAKAKYGEESRLEGELYEILDRLNTTIKIRSGMMGMGESSLWRLVALNVLLKRDANDP